MQSNPATAEWSVKSNLNTDQFNISHPEQSSQASLKEGTINDSSEGKSKSLGEVAWEQIFNNYKPELPYTEFIDCLKKVITYEQFQQLNNDIIRGMESNRQEYCKTNHHTLQGAKKNRLHSLLTYIMMRDV